MRAPHRVLVARRQHRASVLDTYGVTNPAEFFAVATECFFEKPVQMKNRHPELYEELSAKIDPRQATFLGSFALFGMGALIAQELPAPEGEGLASFPKPDGAFFKVGLGPDDDLKGLLSFYLKAITQTAADGSPIVENGADLVNLTRDYFIAARD